MKKPIVVAVLLFLAADCGAIILVPPVVYVASISILSVVLKLGVAFFGWVALSGIASKRLFGASVESIISYSLAAAARE